MCKAILIKTRQGAIYRYTKNIALGIALVIASTNFHTCVSNGVHQVGSNLKMEVSSGVDRHMDVHFVLSDDVEEASLAGYALNVNLIVIEGEQDSNNLLEYRNRSGKGKRASSINKPLNYFIEEEKLNLESEELMIPFKLVPGVGVTKVKVQFLLLNEGGNILSTSYVDWNSSTEESEIVTDNRLMLIDIPKVNDEENIAISVGSVALEQMGMSTAEESPDGSRKRKRNLENSSSAMSLNDAIKRKEKRAKRLAKGKESVETEEEAEVEVLHAFIEEMVIPDVYSRMSEIELVKCANDNSPYAQEAIVRLNLRSGIHGCLQYDLEPDKWSNIEEKALQDQRYVLLLIYNYYRYTYYTKYECMDFFKLPFIEKIIEKVRLAAELGDALAQTNLGYILLFKANDEDKWSTSVKREVAETFHQSFCWLKKAADQGNAHAQLALGRDFYAPDCIYEDYERMAAYYAQAAKQGHQESQFLLGNLYHYGPESQIDDYKWCGFYETLIQAKAGDVEAQSELENTYHSYINRDELDIEKAIYWYNEAAKQGNPESQYQLAIMYFAGRGVGFSNKRAMELLKESAEKNYDLALSKLIDIYYKRGIEEDIIYDSKEALKWLIKAAIGSCDDAGEILGKMYFKGVQMAQDFSNAFFWFYKERYFSEKYSLFVTTQSEEEEMSEGSNDMEGGDNEHEALEAIEANLLGNYQAMLIQKERDHLGTCATFQIGLYKKLEEIMFKFIQWNYKLKTANGLMINSLDFKDPEFKQAIDARQKLTGIIPYIKGHIYQGKSYISFDRPIVQLADEIMEEALNQHLYREAENILNHLKRIYEKLRTKTHKRSIDIETRYHLLDSDLSELDKQKLSQNLEIENALEEIYTNKLKLLEDQIVELRTYYQALFRQIEKGSGIRNKNFRKERNMILRIEEPYAYPRTLFSFKVVEKDFSI
ncbi:hypothetical protein Aasi_1107 [Candidatus Amoebophilus asiaticus 5a2]|uniref:Sel1 domain protein repeat-containing protein n=1 Tax=Amoebophilus asiaticus (strain 5a2) TaxID=452471 RepID=B3ET98_AMOA5|nr:tetratricopeptide repeat protein [Candidatus Amoebophilus asiaticus]ACE06450.1 hypothetical protein Aasi_1107 [Candidatus Amoebophilus asiaticus 5a2]